LKEVPRGAKKTKKKKDLSKEMLIPNNSTTWGSLHSSGEDEQIYLDKEHNKGLP
jgi:hypothetical protein